MECLNCSYCCIKYDVIIINPEFVNEITEENFFELTDEKYFSHKQCDKPCPYLKFINLLLVMNMIKLVVIQKIHVELVMK